MAVQTKTIDYADGDTPLEGYFAWDNAAPGPRPGVLIVHAWAGRAPSKKKSRANSLASVTQVWRWMFMARACSVMTQRKTPSS